MNKSGFVNDEKRSGIPFVRMRFFVINAKRAIVRDGARNRREW